MLPTVSWSIRLDAGGGQLATRGYYVLRDTEQGRERAVRFSADCAVNATGRTNPSASGELRLDLVSLRVLARLAADALIGVAIGRSGIGSST